MIDADPARAARSFVATGARTMRHRSRRVRGMTVGGALCASALLAGWALTVILSPPGPAAGVSPSATVVVVEGEVGEHLSLNVAAEWQVSPVAMNEITGIVTSVDAEPGAMAAQGEPLYSVDGRPVVAAQGDIPAYRAIGPGTVGHDASQLQRMLADLGLYSGPLDGVIGSAATDAIERWQQSIGAPATGEVLLGDIVFVPTLPARLSVAPDIVRRGARLAGGEEAVLALGESPVFTLPVSENQSSRVATGARVQIAAADGSTWAAVVAGRTTAPTGSTEVLALEAPAAGPGSICGTACGSVPISGQTLLAATVVTVETVRGPVVPSVALRSDAQHKLSLIDVAGIEHPVTVVASARGMSVVGGVDDGLVVRIPPADSSQDVTHD